MKKLFLLMVAALLLSSCGGSRRIARLPQNVPSLNEVVADIQNQYVLALTELKKEGQAIEIFNAEITLKVTNAIDASAGFKVLVFSLKGGKKQAKSTAVTYVLSEKPSAAGGSGLIDKKNTLKAAIVAAAKEFNKLQGGLGKLTKDSFELDIVFSVEKTAEAGLGFEIYGITTDGAYSRAVEHEMKLTFKEKPKPANKS